MVEILKKEYWSKSMAFLLPLTGLSKTHKYEINTYLFWREYTIEDYNLIIRFKWEKYDEFLEYCKRVIFPPLERGGYLIESYDFEGYTLFVLDISDWALDVEMFLKGKYSKFSREAKRMITDFHTFYEKGPKINIEISVALEPNDKYSILNDMTAIQYVSQNYELDYDTLKSIGELGGIYSKEKETLKEEEYESG